MQLVLNKVLMLGSQTQTIIGRPILPEAAVHAVVEEHVSCNLFLVYTIFSYSLYKGRVSYVYDFLLVTLGMYGYIWLSYLWS